MDERCVPADELLRDVDRWMDEIRASIEAYDENAALHTPDDGLTTDQRATAALQRPERFSGEHQVARMWLLTSDTARRWGRNGTE